MSARTLSDPRSSSSCEPGSAAAESGPTPGLEVGTGRSFTWYGPRRSSDEGHPVLSSPPHPQREAPRVRDLRCHRDGDGEPGASLSGGVPSAPRPRRQDERWRQVPKARLVIQNPQRPYAEHGHQPVKRWSDPHGDMGSQAEQKRPGRRVATRPPGGNRRVGPYPPWA
jgi:hypothetical protein